MSLYAQYVAPLETSSHRIGSYSGLPSIHSNDCTGFGRYDGQDGGKVCDACKTLRAEKGSRNPGRALNRWGPTLSRCIERRHKGVLTSSDFDDAQKFAANANRLLTPDGMELKAEALAQVQYGRYMVSQCKSLPRNTFKSIGEDSAPGLDTFIENITDVWTANPDFRSSLQVGLIKCAMAKVKFGVHAKMEETVLNFYRFMRTYGEFSSCSLSPLFTLTYYVVIHTFL